MDSESKCPSNRLPLVATPASVPVTARRVDGVNFRSRRVGHVFHASFPTFFPTLSWEGYGNSGASTRQRERANVDTKRGNYGVLRGPGKGRSGGDRGDRTPNLGIANAALSQLSYVPTVSRPERAGSSGLTPNRRAGRRPVSSYFAGGHSGIRKRQAEGWGLRCYNCPPREAKGKRNRWGRDHGYAGYGWDRIRRGKHRPRACEGRTRGGQL